MAVAIGGVIEYRHESSMKLTSRHCKSQRKGAAGSRTLVTMTQAWYLAVGIQPQKEHTNQPLILTCVHETCPLLRRRGGYATAGTAGSRTLVTMIQTWYSTVEIRSQEVIDMNSSSGSSDRRSH